MSHNVSVFVPVKRVGYNFRQLCCIHIISFAVNDLDNPARKGEKHSVSPHSNDVRLEILDTNARLFLTYLVTVSSVCLYMYRIDTNKLRVQITNHILSRDYTIHLDICDKNNYQSDFVLCVYVISPGITRYFFDFRFCFFMIK